MAGVKSSKPVFVLAWQNGTCSVDQPPAWSNTGSSLIQQPVLDGDKFRQSVFSQPHPQFRLTPPDPCAAAGGINKNKIERPLGSRPAKDVRAYDRNSGSRCTRV
jgi:hypothetical protein